MSSLPVPVSLDSTLRHLGSADPRRPFLIDAREPERPLEYTWGDADRQVDALAEQIAAHACRSVGVLLDNSYRNLCLIYAVMRAGKHLVLIDPEWGEAAKQAIVDEMRLDALASEHPLEGALAGLRLALDFERSATRRLDRAAHSHMILFTSGTTGQPKGIELSQQAMLHAYRIGRDCLGIGEHTRSGCFYRISGLGILGINFLFPLLYGGSAVLLPLHCWADSEGFWECVERFGISFLYLVPPVVNHMVKEGSACRCSACSASPARRAWTPTCRRPSSATTRRWRTSTASASAASPSSSASVAAMRSTTRWDLPSAWNSS